MALLFKSGVFPISMFRIQALSSATLRPRFNLKVKSNISENAGAAILWYKHDLRIEDHPGLVAASKYSCVVPLYIFDCRILSRFSDEMLELLLFALEDIRKLLKEQGSDLMIRFGHAEQVIGDLVKEVQATSIFVEEEVEHELCVMLDMVKESLVETSPGMNPKIEVWSCPFYEIESSEDLPVSYEELKKLKLNVVPPIMPPKIPDMAVNFTPGALPSLADVKRFMDDVSYANNVKKEWTSITKLSAKSVLKRKRLKRNIDVGPAEIKETIQLESGNNANQRRKVEKSAFATSQRNIVGGGNSLVLNAFAAYLRYLEGTARYDWQEVHEKLRIAEQSEGSSFEALFGSAILLGIVSRRRMYFEAIKYEKERNGGFLSPFGYSTTTITSAVEYVSSIEWYWLLSLKCQKSGAGTLSVRTWRWNNYLIQYTFAGCKGPAILLVHGFGAFLEHFRDNICSLAESGNRVWALTLIGFGKSEKPNIVYTELVWAQLLRDFIVEVVREPVHVVGNSIGGYCVAIVSGLWSSLAVSVVLINSAGNTVGEYVASDYKAHRETSGAVRLGARLLLRFLRFNIRNTLMSFYPTKPERADDQLINEMLRASYDPGVIYVMESIFSFDLSLPLNHLLEEFEGRILIIQGMKDPLINSKSIVDVFTERCKGIVIKVIDAGHCPHDELPDEVNSIINEWVVSVESRTPHVSLK